MHNPEALDNICNLLSDKYDSPKDDPPDRGSRAAARLRDWVSGKMPYAYEEFLEQHLVAEHVDLLFDAFWQVLPFGTGGRRGKVGYGSNRMNPTTVAMTVQGHCNYLRGAFGEKQLEVVVANDVRVFNDIAGVYQFLGEDHPLVGVSSRSLARLACEVYAGNGIVACFAEPEAEWAVMTTPMLSYLIDELGAVGGVNLSASHNPPDDNGIKVYDEYGSQPIAPQDQQLIDAMERATDVQTTPFEQACQDGLIKPAPSNLTKKYIDLYVGKFENLHTPTDDDPPVVYTPLCGCGLATAGEILDRLGFKPLLPPNQNLDGTFEVIPLKAPNPEVPQASEPAKAYADEKGSGIVLSSDPDADRVGLEVKLADGAWYHFDGNQTAAVVCYFLMLDPDGPQRKGLVIETLVTTKLLSEMAEVAGDSFVIDDLLVGVKYIADVLKTLKRGGQYGQVACSPEDLVLGAEESHGMLIAPSIREKDSSGPCMYLAALYQKLHREGRTILDYYTQILEELGGFDNVNRSIMMAGVEGMRRKDRIMKSLRESPPEELAGQRVSQMVDYWDEKAFGPFKSESDKLPRNVLQFFCDRFIITVRPSGTEPKLKFYCQLLPGDEKSSAKGMDLLQEVRSEAEAVARPIYNELLDRIDVSLGEAGLLLPDIIELDLKTELEQTTAPELHEALANDGFSDLDGLLTWLRDRTSAMSRGADSLPAVKTAIACLCGQWQDEIGGKPLLKELADWAGE